jgi:D-proline reductase (dithiol) PrdB
MARLEKLDPVLAKSLRLMPVFEHDSDPWTTPRPLAQARLAIVTTAGLVRRGEDPFQTGETAYRALPGDLDPAELLLSHISVNFDRTGFQQDINVVFPIDRLRELVGAGRVGSLAGTHYSFMGAVSAATAQVVYAEYAPQVAERLKADGVDTVFLTPV